VPREGVVAFLGRGAAAAAVAVDHGTSLPDGQCWVAERRSRGDISGPAATDQALAME